MSSLATPDRSSAAITRRIRPPLSASAALALAPSVSSPNVKSAVSGTTRAVAVPLTVTVRTSGAAEPCAVPGPTTTSAPAAASTAARAAIEIVFIVSSRFVDAVNTAPASAYVTSRRGGRGLAEAVQVRLPTIRDPRRREVDEEDRSGRLRLRPERHRDLLRQAVALAHVARRARGDDVLPDRVATAAARHDVVEGQLAAGSAAVHAAPAVAGEQGAARDLALERPRHAHVLDEPDHMRPGKGNGRRSEGLIELLDHLGLALEHEHVGTPNGGDVQWLVARVENQNLLHARKL